MAVYMHTDQEMRYMCIHNDHMRAKIKSFILAQGKWHWWGGGGGITAAVQTQTAQQTKDEGGVQPVSCDAVRVVLWDSALANR